VRLRCLFCARGFVVGCMEFDCVVGWVGVWVQRFYFAMGWVGLGQTFGGLGWVELKKLDPRTLTLNQILRVSIYFTNPICINNVYSTKDVCTIGTILTAFDADDKNNNGNDDQKSCDGDANNNDCHCQVTFVPCLYFLRNSGS